MRHCKNWATLGPYDVRRSFTTENYALRQPELLRALAELAGGAASQLGELARLAFKEFLKWFLVL